MHQALISIYELLQTAYLLQSRPRYGFHIPDPIPVLDSYLDGMLRSKQQLKMDWVEAPWILLRILLGAFTIDETDTGHA